MSDIIKVDDLSFGYSSPVLKGLSFSVENGDFLSIAGPNGAGKTTLLNLICGFDKPKSGKIQVDQKPLSHYSHKDFAKKVAVVRQEFVPVFDFTVTELVSMARIPYTGIFGFETPKDRDIVRNALEVTDTYRFASRPLTKLSGGERQRVFIARAIAQDTPIIILDEPTSFLDIMHQIKIYDLLKTEQKKNGKTIITVSHDINLAIAYSDNTLLLGNDFEHSKGPTTTIFTKSTIMKYFGVDTEQIDKKDRSYFLPISRLSDDQSSA